MRIYLKFKNISFLAISFVVFFLVHSFGNATPLIYNMVEISNVDTVGYYYNETEYVVKDEQIKDRPSYIYENYERRWNYIKTYRVIGIEKKENETFVDFIISPKKSLTWGVISENIFLRDKKTGDLYKIRRENNGIPLGRALVFKGKKTEYICYTFVFPPLPPSVKVVDLVRGSSKTLVRTDNMKNFSTGTWNDMSLKVKKYEKIKKSSPRIIE